jgi:hypothetical protein
MECNIFQYGQAVAEGRRSHAERQAYVGAYAICFVGSTCSRMRAYTWTWKCTIATVLQGVTISHSITQVLERTFPVAFCILRLGTYQ